MFSHTFTSDFFNCEFVYLDVRMLKLFIVPEQCRRRQASLRIELSAQGQKVVEEVPSLSGPAQENKDIVCLSLKLVYE